MNGMRESKVKHWHNTHSPFDSYSTETGPIAIILRKIFTCTAHTNGSKLRLMVNLERIMCLCKCFQSIDLIFLFVCFLCVQDASTKSHGSWIGLVFSFNQMYTNTLHNALYSDWCFRIYIFGFIADFNQIDMCIAHGISTCIQTQHFYIYE